MALDISLRKIHTGEQALYFPGPKIWTKIGHSTKKRKNYSFFHTFSEERSFRQTV